MKNQSTEQIILSSLADFSGYYGAMYLTELIHHPNQPIHATQLRNLFNEPDQACPLDSAQRAGEDYESDFDFIQSVNLPPSVNPGVELPIEKADRTAIEQVKKRLVKVLAQIAHARNCHDEAPLEDLYDERDKLLDWLKQTVNRWGRPRFLADNTQKDYQTVRKNINKIIAKLEAVSPQQAEFVRKHLKTGHRFEWSS